MPQTFKAISAGFLVLASVVLAFQMTGGEAKLSAQGGGATAVLFGWVDNHSHSHQPTSGHHSKTCSVAACASIAMVPDGSSYQHSSLPNLAGTAPDDFMPQGIILARDPPVPRFGSF